jgi:hypothetical protein
LVYFLILKMEALFSSKTSVSFVCYANYIYPNVCLQHFSASPGLVSRGKLFLSYLQPLSLSTFSLFCCFIWPSHLIPLCLPYTLSFTLTEFGHRYVTIIQRDGILSM